MTETDLTQCWSRRFGLASAPLFESSEAPIPGSHQVLLDGGNGTFALSVSSEELWRAFDPAAWVWSSDIPHHVTITGNKVAVLRWDRPREPQVYARPSVEQNPDGFYARLTKDRLRSNKTVVDHLLGLFRRIRSLGHAAGVPDDRATDVFTATLATLATPAETTIEPDRFGLANDAFELRARLNRVGLAAAEEEISRASGSLSLLRLHPALAIRHAGGQLFQEAHFELLRAPVSTDLFGFIEAPQVREISRGGTHFTPPALARIIVEQALSSVGDLSARAELTISDPACGSGAFLHEALRALRRLGFNGRLRMVGHDISPPAIAMARFVLSASLRDWSPASGAELILHIGDSLGELGVPEADVIVMNPPFIAFMAQTEEQRDRIKAAMGEAANARGDYSMAFVVRAIEALRPNGVLGTLFPASMLSSKAAETWRERVASSGEVRLLATIGEFGLFTHAQVQVACMVMRRGSGGGGEFIAMMTENDARATGEALRFLRKNGASPPALPTVEETWSLFPVSQAALRARGTWRFLSPQSERLLRALGEAPLSTVGELFDVGQGIQTGLNDALLLDEEEWRGLHPKERRFFRIATKSDSIQNGHVTKPYYVFFPHTEGGPLFKTEDEVKAAVPGYFRHYLAPNRERLANRAAILAAKRSDWWGLMRTRAWNFNKAPRIISKFFAGEGGFVGDYEATYAVVMGHVWMPKEPQLDDEEWQLPLTELLAAYVAFFNSSLFVRVLSLYAPHVAGGQYDLSWRHVKTARIPNMWEVSSDPKQGRVVRELATLGKEVDLTDPIWCAETQQLVATLYGTRALSDL